MGLDSFKPAGAVQVQAHQLSGPLTPNGMPIGKPAGQYTQPILQQVQPQQQIQQQPVGHQPMFGGAPQGAPKGAQPVPLAGSPAMGASQQPKLPLSPQHQQLQGPKAPSDAEVHVIRVEGRGLDGNRYVAEFEAVFPRGTKVMGVTEVEPS
jgi:hypothetical protein